ncbi:hypothetical protein WJX73_007781 [Symbiochloris irregularis]|uniref:DNA-directed primase/polymerase protein n=1 Tax=Symbiochloris irregularis TaxID=706552 RepID=A0AAW1NIA0_9CHLO
MPAAPGATSLLQQIVSGAGKKKRKAAEAGLHTPDRTASKLSHPVQAQKSQQLQAASPVPASGGPDPGNRFYSSWRAGEVERQVLQLLAAAKRSTQGNARCYRVFPLQQPAFQWIAEQPDAGILRLFSEETGAKGKRVFIVTTHAEFWRRYQTVVPLHRHFYEVICEGAPCHLYFDLEYQKEHNQGTDGQALVDHLLEMTSTQLQEQFGLALDRERLVELDSSTPSKFSRHLIVPVPGAAFANNAHVGAFVACLLGRDQQSESGPRLTLSKDGQGETACFVDVSVYSRNRAFRLYLSSKLGKDSLLLPTERFLGVKWQAAERGASPFPEVDQFITSICNQGGVQGRVRSWLMMEGTGALLLSMAHNRFCNNVGRPHKSNGIFYVIDLTDGTWYQKCFDPDCRNYRSETSLLPPHVLRTLKAPAPTESTSQGCSLFDAEDDNWDQYCIETADNIQSFNLNHVVITAVMITIAVIGLQQS